jgi:hypothetical protein
MPIIHLAALLLCFAYCVYCVVRALQDEKSVSAADHSQAGDPAPDLDDAAKREKSRLYLARFSDKAKATTRTALLWLTALAIIWTSALEGLRRDVTNVRNQLKEVYQAQQALGNQGAANYLAKKDLSERIAALKTRIDEEQKLNSFEQEQIAASRSGQKNDKKLAQDLANRIKRIKERIEKEGNAEEAELNKLEATKSKEEKNIQLRFVEIEKRHEELRTAFVALKERQQAVAFDILGQKFQAPAVYAPLIWCLLLWGLILYLARARASLLLLAVRALALLRTIDSTTPGQLKNIVSDAPWWLAPLPPARYKLEHLTGEVVPPGGELNTSQLLNAFGWQPSFHRLFSLCSTLCLGLLVLAQLRVVWLGLDMARQIGASYERGLEPALFVGLLALTAYAVWVWLTPTRALEGEAGTNRQGTSFASILLIFVVVGVLALLVLTWRYPPTGDALGRSLGAALFNVTLYVVLTVAVLCWYLWVTLTDSYFMPAGRGVGDEGRRRLLFSAAGVMGAIVLGFVLARSGPAAPRKNRRRLDKKKRRKKKRQQTKQKECQKNKQHVALKPGFYRNTTTHIIHYVTPAGVIAGVPPCPPLFLESFVPYEPLSNPLRPNTDNEEPAGRSASVDEHQSPPNENNSNYEATERRAGLVAAPRLDTEQQSPVPVAASDYEYDSPLLRRDESMPKDIQSPPPRGPARPRVNLTQSSPALEQAALLILQKQSLEAHDYDRACQMLLYAIKHDLYLKSKLRRLPSFRLYDLLAGLAVRFEREQYLVELEDLLDADISSVLFRSRREKWRNPESSWYKDWRNKKRPVQWSGLKL